MVQSWVCFRPCPNLKIYEKDQNKGLWGCCCITVTFLVMSTSCIFFWVSISEELDTPDPLKTVHVSKTIRTYWTTSSSQTMQTVYVMCSEDRYQPQLPNIKPLLLCLEQPGLETGQTASGADYGKRAAAIDFHMSALTTASINKHLWTISAFTPKHLLPRVFVDARVVSTKIASTVIHLQTVHGYNSTPTGCCQFWDDVTVGHFPISNRHKLRVFFFLSPASSWPTTAPPPPPILHFFLILHLKTPPWRDVYYYHVSGCRARSCRGGTTRDKNPSSIISPW